MAATAVIRIQDVQVRVHKDDVLRVPRLSTDVGKTVTFDQVLLVGGDEVKVGTPLVKGASVKAEVVEHGLGKKVIVYKKKRRKGYECRNGHRQPYTSIRVKTIKG